MSLVETLQTERRERLARFAKAAANPKVKKKAVVIECPVRPYTVQMFRATQQVARPLPSRRRFDPKDELAWMIAIEGFVPAQRGVEPAVRRIMDEVLNHTGLTLDEIRSDSRMPNLVYARHLFCYLCRKLSNKSFPDIGRALGGKDHSTQIYAYRKVEKGMHSDEWLCASINMLMDMLTRTK